MQASPSGEAMMMVQVLPSPVGQHLDQTAMIGHADGNRQLLAFLGQMAEHVVALFAGNLLRRAIGGRRDQRCGESKGAAKGGGGGFYPGLLPPGAVSRL